MAAIIYGLCALMAFLCTYLLLQSYRQSKYRLLLWGGFCFAGLTASNILLVIDKLIVPTMDLSYWRYGITLISMTILIYGLIFDKE